MLDIRIVGGTLIDGTGQKRRDADIGIRDGRIVEIVEPGALTEQARESVDAAGKVVCPGFVDVHTHYDGQVTWDPLLTPSFWHGVTTVVRGPQSAYQAGQ